MIETRLFHYFLAIERAGNFTRAADQLFISQSTLSKQMQDLEVQLGKQLFIRGKRQVTLTEEGQFFKEKAQEILQLVEQTEITLKQADNILAGDLFIGAAEVPSMESIAQQLATLQKEHSQLHIHIHSGDADQILQRIKTGVVDVGLLLNPPMLTELNYHKLPFTHPFGLFVPKDHPLADEEAVRPELLRDLPLITSQQFMKDPHRIEYFGPLGSQLKIVATYNLIYNAVFLAKTGIGLLMGLENMLDLTNSNLVFKPFSPAITTDLYLVTKKYQQHSPAVNALIQVLESIS
ncbi:LysR family transcriptional regulator [Streptococcus moroccensis]|uniref:DNA-binding transcriptional LysR family regulator n=1 Tax=Streptococcus moroccensis TaxID=1451356 RepID=A0ABT9YRL4_9STRE|nr:LysR family transcriptional regulator [Streptococcus moroccensis]MDQ0222640.1 DNA-binding transcriptional LysR family regulator [Streptococcus moroccensis]